MESRPCNRTCTTLRVTVPSMSRVLTQSITWHVKAVGIPTIRSGSPSIARGPFELGKTPRSTRSFIPRVSADDYVATDRTSQYRYPYRCQPRLMPIAVNVSNKHVVQNQTI
ncbi:hypothetical protein TIFTF001_016686 [Ficus carica]|uniref:Uncharacterized protein n=1 Tax=Ficus carica TaxID=3494 RepID=A0AA88A7Z8_FICCA|nr:hypothetical protein TIFTF001_016686 [Ficus carica]